MGFFRENVVGALVFDDDDMMGGNFMQRDEEKLYFLFSSSLHEWDVRDN
jgi:hypothetical protein